MLAPGLCFGGSTGLEKIDRVHIPNIAEMRGKVEAGETANTPAAGAPPAVPVPEAAN